MPQRLHGLSVHLQQQISVPQARSLCRTAALQLTQHVHCHAHAGSVRLTFGRTAPEVASSRWLTGAPGRRLLQLEDEAEALGVREQPEFSGSVGEVVRDSHDGQDGDPLLLVVFLALSVDHQDGDVVATLLPLKHHFSEWRSKPKRGCSSPSG